MSELNAPHNEPRLTGEVILEAGKPGVNIQDLTQTDLSEEREGPIGFDPIAMLDTAIYLNYFNKLIGWLKMPGNAEAVALRMFASLGRTRSYHLKYSSSASLEEIRAHVRFLVDTLPGDEYVPIRQLQQHITTLDDLWPHIKRVRTRPHSAVPARSKRGADAKSWRWLLRQTI